MKSIIKGDKEDRCYICGRAGWIERHHIFNGTANRKKSEKYGLTVNLCHFCHNEPPNGVHFNSNRDLRLKRLAQEQAMEYYGWDIDDFIKIFGKNYL